jgi:RNA polymerase sigma factor (sigma-70 family)
MYARVSKARKTREGPDLEPSLHLEAMTTHAAAPLPRTALKREPLTPRDALAAFLEAGRREMLIRELARKWHTLGQSEVEDAVDHAITEAAHGLRATREQAIYDYLRTAAHRLLVRRKQRQGRVSAPMAIDTDFDRMVGDSLSPEEALLAKEYRQLVLDLVASLDDRTLAVMRLKHVEGMERKDVAAMLGLSEKQVKKAIEKGHRACRDRYDQAVGEGLCSERAHALTALAAGTATARQRREAKQHLAHCKACRETQRALGTTQRAAAALFPLPAVAPLAAVGMGWGARAARRLLGGDHPLKTIGTGGASAAAVAKVAAVVVAAAGAAHSHAAAPQPSVHRARISLHPGVATPKRRADKVPAHRPVRHTGRPRAETPRAATRPQTTTRMTTTPAPIVRIPQAPATAGAPLLQAKGPVVEAKPTDEFAAP